MHDEPIHDEVDHDVVIRGEGVTGENEEDSILDTDDEAVQDFDDEDFTEVTDIPLDQSWSEYEEGGTVDWDDEPEGE